MIILTVCSNTNFPISVGRCILKYRNVHIIYEHVELLIMLKTKSLPEIWMRLSISWTWRSFRKNDERVKRRNTVVRFGHSHLVSTEQAHGLLAAAFFVTNGVAVLNLILAVKSPMQRGIKADECVCGRKFSIEYDINKSKKVEYWSLLPKETNIKGRNTNYSPTSGASGSNIPNKVILGAPYIERGSIMIWLTIQLFTIWDQVVCLRPKIVDYWIPCGLHTNVVTMAGGVMGNIRLNPENRHIEMREANGVQRLQTYPRQECNH